MPRLRQILDTSNERYLQAQQDVLSSYLDRGQLQALRQPSLSATGRRTPGLHLDDPRLMALLQALTAFAYLVGQARFRTKELLEDVRQALGLGSVSLLGFSFGGGVALAYAVHFPQVTRHCITVGGYVLGDGGEEHVAAQAQAQFTRVLARHASALWYPEVYAVLETWTERVLAATDHAEVDALFGTVAPFYFAHPERPEMAAYIAA